MGTSTHCGMSELLEDGQRVVQGLSELGKTSVPPSGSENASISSYCDHQGCPCDPPLTVDQHSAVNHHISQ